MNRSGRGEWAWHMYATVAHLTEQNIDDQVSTGQRRGHAVSVGRRSMLS